MDLSALIKVRGNPFGAGNHVKIHVKVSVLFNGTLNVNFSHYIYIHMYVYSEQVAISS